MSKLSTTLLLTALGATSVAFAQQPAETSAQQPPSSTAPQEESPNATAPPSDPSAPSSSESTQEYKQTLMKRCMTQVQASNPGVSQQDIRQFCEREVNAAPPPQR